MTGSSRQRRRARYSGRVQGVGFRYTTVSVSRAFAVTGYVRNLPDGQVEVVAEGASEILDRFFAAVVSRLGAFIESHEIELAPAEEELTTFSIHY